MMTRRLRRIFLPCLIAAGILSSNLLPTNTYATDAEIDSIVADEYEAELCGWGTHDSAPIEVETAEDCSPRTATPRRTSVTFDSSLATVAAAACATAGISVEQIVEPFVMVGPQLTESLESVRKFQQWWASAAEQQITTTAADPVVEKVVPQNDSAPVEVSHVPIVDFDSEIPASEPRAENLASAADPDVIEDEIDADSELESISRDDLSLLAKVDEEEIRQELDDLATEEPIDAIGVETAAFGPSILVVESGKETEEAVDSDRLAIDAIDLASSDSNEPLTVGSSPVIFTIGEAYLPYDLAVRDLHSNSVLSISKRPFCIRARMELPAFDLVFDDLKHTAAPVKRDEIDTEPAVQIDPHFVVSGSADCLLDDWVWRATLALEQDGPVRKWLRPHLAGRQVAALVVKHNNVALALANRLAKIWPRDDQRLPTAGAQLLARAEAVEAIEVERNPGAPDLDDTQQLAQATATLKQWVSAVEGAATTLTSRWLTRLAEVPPSPTDSGKTSRR